ncbi:Uncharacterized protein HZ326_13494 [Fusarium oxysporum f. sp. albedinis]|nr:Uncharacterized protein HZ326_13494 [Fusarium oxysporum f. sp. albedinis]
MRVMFVGHDADIAALLSQQRNNRRRRLERPIMKLQPRPKPKTLVVVCPNAKTRSDMPKSLVARHWWK